MQEKFSHGDENKINVYEAIAYCLGDIIGSGIFVSPTAILRHTGCVGLSLCVWIISAIIAVIGALVYVELGTKIRKSGCDFAYISHVGWHPLAVGFLWVSVTLTYPTILAIQTLTFGEYIVQGLHKLMCIEDAWRDALRRLIGFIALGVLVFINMFSLRNFAGRFQVAVTFSKLCVISIIICTGAYYIIFKGKTGMFDTAFVNSNTDLGSIMLGVYAGLFAYNGWDILNFGTEEIENPRRTLPIAALGGIGFSAIVYIAMNIAYFSVMTVDEFLVSDAVAVTFAEYTLGDFCYIVPFLIAFLLLGNLNTTIFGCSRYLLAGAKRNVAPTMVKCVHEESMSPRAAVLVEFFIAVSLSFLGDLDQLISYMSFAMWMQRTCSQVALLYMRFNDWPFPKDAFRTPIILPIIFLMISISLLVIPARKDPHIVIYGCSAVIAGLIIYFAFIYTDNRPACLRSVNEWTVMVTQIILNVVPMDDQDEQLAIKS
ncbi:amino acid permease domain-containing protein [Ditylenchus destructor]|nr:amino acid permease domain-containing protein [Ditylenchus destructor]